MSGDGICAKFGKITEWALETNTKVFAAYGAFVSTKKGTISMFLLGLLIGTVLSIGIYNLRYEDNLENLWIPEGSRAEKDTTEFQDKFGGGSRLSILLLTPADKRLEPSSSTDFGMLTADSILAWRDTSFDIQQPEAINDFTLEWELPVGGTPTLLNITLSDICDRPKQPPSLKPWTAPPVTPFNNILMTGAWVSQSRTDSGGLFYITNCLGAFAANALLNNNRTTVGDGDYVQLQMWFEDEDVDALLDGSTLEKAAAIAARPGLEAGWGIDRFPCNRPNVMDCFQEGVYDYPEDLTALNNYGYSIGALADAFTVNAGGPFVEGSLNVLTSGVTWFNQCAFQMTTDITNVAIAAGQSAGVAAATASALFSQFQIVGIGSAATLGYHWRPTITSLNTGSNEFAYSFYEAQQNALDYDLETCVAEGYYRKMDSITKTSGFPFYQISAGTPLNGGCCLNWAGVKVSPRLYAGGQSPSAEDFDSSSDPATFQGFVAGLRIANSNINTNSPFLIPRLNEERGVDTSVDPKELEDMVRAWEKQAIERLTEMWDHKADSGFGAGEAYEDYQILFLLDRSVNDLFDDAANVEGHLLIIGYAVLVIYACGTFVEWQPTVAALVYSRGSLCLSGIIVIGLAMAASFGVMGWAAISLSPMNSTLVPFLSMGLGIDDLFIIMHEYMNGHSKQDAVHHRIVQTLMNAGSSVTVTSAANFAAFLIPAVFVPLPAVYTFSGQMAAGVVLNWLFLLMVFCPIMVLDAWRVSRHVGICPGVSTTTKESNVFKASEGLSISKFTKSVLVPLYSNRIFKVIVVVLWVGFTIWLPIYGDQNTKEGLRLSDVTTKGSYVKDYLYAQEELFPLLPGTVMTREVDYKDADGNSVDLASYQDEILAFISDTKSNAYLDQVTTMEDLHWLPSLISFYNNVLTDTLLEALFGANTTALNRPSETIPEDLFYPVLSSYLSGFGATNTDSLVCRVEYTGELTDCSTVDGITVKVAGNRGSVFFQGLYGDQDYVDAIESLRESGDASGANFNGCCNDLSNGTRIEPVQMFFTGYLFNYWQQYVTINELTIQTIGFSALGVFVALVIFQASPWSSLLVSLVLISSVLQLYGLMSFFGLKLNGFSVTNLSIAVGMGVEFSAHIAYAFLRANAKSNSREERMKIAMIEIFPPMLSGALTTFISVVVLAFAKYPFFSSYYFEMISLMILLTFVNGMVLMPILLSLIGPGGLTAEEMKEIEDTGDFVEEKGADEKL